MRLLHLPCFAAQYHRLMAEDPPEHPVRPPCTLTKKWSYAPPDNTRPAAAGEARAGPRPVRRFAFPRGGDG